MKISQTYISINIIYTLIHMPKNKICKMDLENSIQKC